MPCAKKSKPSPLEKAYPNPSLSPFRALQRNVLLDPILHPQRVFVKRSYYEIFNCGRNLLLSQGSPASLRANTVKASSRSE
jgi:hypothetical protein